LLVACRSIILIYIGFILEILWEYSFNDQKLNLSDLWFTIFGYREKEFKSLSDFISIVHDEKSINALNKSIDLLLLLQQQFVSISINAIFEDGHKVAANLELYIQKDINHQTLRLVGAYILPFELHTQKNSLIASDQSVITQESLNQSCINTTFEDGSKSTYLSTLLKKPKSHNTVKNMLLTEVDDWNQSSTVYREIRESNNLINSELVIAVLTHEIKNPLSNIVGYLDLINTQDLEASKNIHFLEVAKSQAVFMNKILDSFNSYYVKSNVDKDIHSFTNAIEINHFIQANLKNLVALDHVNRVQFKPDENIPTIKSNGYLLKLLLGNLISNAVKYSSDKVSIETFYKVGFLVISITDFGIGMDMNEIPFIFTQYWRSERAKSYSTGTGVGMYVAKKIADFLNIELRVTSELNAGTKVELIFNEKLLRQS
jgi:nitrogen-specific signal transduction histidine kinase